MKESIIPFSVKGFMNNIHIRIVVFENKVRGDLKGIEL